jgi:hypothetical protein
VRCKSLQLLKGSRTSTHTQEIAMAVAISMYNFQAVAAISFAPSLPQI